MALRELNFKLLEKVFTIFDENNIIIFNFKLPAWYDHRTSCSTGNKCTEKTSDSSMKTKLMAFYVACFVY